MTNFKGLYVRRGIFALGWFFGVLGFGMSPVSNAAIIAMLFCLVMFVTRLVRLYNIGDKEKQHYIEYQLRWCRRRINWLDSRCLEYRRQEEDMEEKMNKWEELLNGIKNDASV